MDEGGKKKGLPQKNCDKDMNKIVRPVIDYDGTGISVLLIVTLVFSSKK